jgi:predicted aconitase/predicted aconitase with swiveling domain
MELPKRLSEQLDGKEGPTRQKAARLVVDLARVAKAESFVEIDHAHVSGVSVITGGHGLRTFLKDLSGDPSGTVVIPTTLNSAGCDREKMEEMGIAWPNFLEQQFEIVQAYDRLGIEATLSCTPYDRGIELEGEAASWAESNAVCYSNTWTSLITNRESGLSALATALTGYAPSWGLHLEGNRKPNIRVVVECDLETLSDYSILGDWIGKNAKPEWNLPFGPMPYVEGLDSFISFARKKALTAAAANYGSPMMWVEGHTEPPSESIDSIKWEGELVFTQTDLDLRYEELSPKGQVDLIVIGCPQASLEEMRTTAAALRTHMEFGESIPDQRLWVFTSQENYALAEADGTVSMMEEAGAVVLVDTCPEVTPYNREKYNHLLTNSMKAEHYLTSGLNRIPTSVASIEECVRHAIDPLRARGPTPTLSQSSHGGQVSAKTPQQGLNTFEGEGLDSQNDFSIEGRAMVTDVPITYLGYVNRDTGVIEETGHPLDGRAIEDTILIYPKGSGSTVAPYVLMGLLYENKGPLAIINRDVCPLTLPACSLLNVPYGHGFVEDPCMVVNDGDRIRFKREQGKVSIEILERV